MSFTDPAGWWLALLALPIIALHVLRPRRQRTVVSSTYLWRDASRPVSSAQPWQRLRPSWLLLLQLLAVALLAGAVAHPVRLLGRGLAQHTVFIIDDSGSMSARDGHPLRIDDAKRRAMTLRDRLPDRGLASVVVAGTTPRVVLSTSADKAAFASAVGAIEPGSGVPDFPAALTLAASLETPEAPIGFVLLSDGGLTDAERKLLPPGTRYERIGADATNRAITQLSVESQGAGLVAHVTIRNTGGASATQRLRVDVDGRTAASEDLVLDAGQTVGRSLTLPRGDRVEAFLEGEDLLSADDHAFALGSARPPLKVLLAGPDDPYLAKLLDVVPGLTVEHVAASAAADGYDLAIYDQVPVPARPGAPYLAIAPPGGAPGVTTSGTVDRPAVTLVQSDDALLEGLDLSAVGIASAQRISAPGDRVLVGAEDAPLLVSGTRTGRPFAYLSFALADSNLPLQVAYPVLIDRLVTQLSGAAGAAHDLRVGDALPVAGATASQVQAPGGARFDLPDGAPVPHADRAGFWTIRSAGRTDRVVAVNVPERESSLHPVASIETGNRPLRPGEKPVRGERSLLVWPAIALLLVVVLEFLRARRRAGVSRRQWRVAVAARIAVAALVIAALIGPTVTRQQGRVATMFLVDGSDSLGPSGREEAARWVRDAMAHQPQGARAGVAVFGGDARLELTIQKDATFTTPSVKVDQTRTNLAGALRLAQAVLPADARRRVVVVSDGRPTDGDATAEIDRLKAAGIPVEVHAVGSTSGDDVSVTRVDAPSSVRKGEKITVRAVVTSSTGGPARVVLRQDGAVLEERVITTNVGDTTVTFDHVATGPGTERFQVTVSQAADSVAQNDTGYAAVQVDGPTRVLLAEGADGEAKPLADALTAGGIVAETIAARDLPGVEQLAGYSSTVLVDVDAQTLSAPQVAALTAASRDLGKGLVTIGGDRAYALGGYRNSDLEGLLPVISEVTDPKRKLDVAQVLAIDTSGSMAACHCAGGASRGQNGMPINGNMIEGGIDKTDISRAAAARTIEALSANDEVGLLAFNTEQQWIIPLQKLPSEQVVTEGLSRLHPVGGTDLHQPLLKAAESLKASKAKLKHVILFTDGFSNDEALNTLVAQAKQLFDEGITVSVLATGEVAYQELEKVAMAGHGRFYAGKDLAQVPQIMAQEALVAARDVVQEGSFLPRVTSAAAPVRDLTASPPLLGYIATTAKPTASTQLQIGNEGDPLLASWQVGLGKVTSWTSDTALRWSKNWASWNGYVAFWSAVVKDTFPIGGANGSAVQASVVGDTLKVTVEGTTAWPDAATATARVTGPDLSGHEVTLTRISGTTFAGELSATDAGTYAVGATVSGPSGSLLSAATLANQSYAAEYKPGAADAAYLTGLSTRSGGRGAITPTQAFDTAGLRKGRVRVALAGWLLLAAAILWPIAVALSRLSLKARALTPVLAAGRTLSRIVAKGRPRRPGRPTTAAATERVATDTVAVPADPPSEEPAAASGGPPDTLQQLLARKRGRDG